MNLAHALDALTAALVVAGVFFAFGGAVGLLRFPDFYSRLHAGGVTDTLAAELIILGLVFQSPDWITGVKLMLIAFFLFFTSPTATHSVAAAARFYGLEPKLGPWRAGDGKDGEAPR